mmetsp:Transcript_4655/g.11405  ORF Transcript_4655/g.11405 Transcript_4655/m.11405 type:complete len:204 (-) Transcript_4655:1027-1638(-)
MICPSPIEARAKRGRARAPRPRASVFFRVPRARSRRGAAAPLRWRRGHPIPRHAVDHFLLLLLCRNRVQPVLAQLVLGVRVLAQTLKRRPLPSHRVVRNARTRLLALRPAQVHRGNRPDPVVEAVRARATRSPAAVRRLEAVVFERIAVIKIMIIGGSGGGISAGRIEVLRAEGPFVVATRAHDLATRAVVVTGGHRTTGLRR